MVDKIFVFFLRKHFWAFSETDTHTNQLSLDKQLNSLKETSNWWIIDLATEGSSIHKSNRANLTALLVLFLLWVRIWGVSQNHLSPIRRSFVELK